MDGQLALKGLDDFTREELEQFWQEKDKDITRILSVGISTRDTCNLRCVYCYGDQNTRAANLLSLDGQIGIISQAYGLGAKTLIVCGDWEPAMDENLMPIIERAFGYNMTTLIFTNGVVMGDDHLARRVHGVSAKELSRFLFDHDCTLMVKLDSLDHQVYERIVGVEGSYDKFRSALSNLAEAGYGHVTTNKFFSVTRWAFANVVLRDNIEELGRIRDFAVERNAQLICKLPAIVNRATEHADMMFPTTEYDQLREKYVNRYSYKKETLTLAERCLAWFYGIVIDNEGNARQCYTIPYRAGEGLGNVRDYSLAELLTRKKLDFELNKGWPCPAKNTLHANSTPLGQKRPLAAHLKV